MLVVLARIERLARQAAAPASGESRGLTTVETLPDAPADTNADRQTLLLLDQPYVDYPRCFRVSRLQLSRSFDACQPRTPPGSNVAKYQSSARYGANHIPPHFLMLGTFSSSREVLI